MPQAKSQPWPDLPLPHNLAFGLGHAREEIHRAGGQSLASSSLTPSRKQQAPPPSHSPFPTYGP